jgi:hypothetical protein
MAGPGMAGPGGPGLPPRQFNKGGTVPMKYGSFSGMGRLEQAELQKRRGD